MHYQYFALIIWASILSPVTIIIVMKTMFAQEKIMKNSLRLLLPTLILCLISSQGGAWSFHTHRKITTDAVRLMPESFRKEFSGQKSHFLKGSTDPDTLIQDFANHVYHVDGSRSDGLYRIQAIFNKAVELIRTNAEPEKTAYLLGLMSHYIADLNQPLHTAGQGSDPDESDYHSAYERDINQHLKDLELPQGFFTPVDVVETRVIEMATEANRFYADIGSAYRSKAGLSAVMEITRRQIAASTKNVVEFWLAAYREAGRTFLQVSEATTPVAENSWLSEDSSTEKIADTININLATTAELTDFFKISQQKAAKIIDGRPFSSAYDLAKIEGFNVHFVRRNKDRIRLK